MDFAKEEERRAKAGRRLDAEDEETVELDTGSMGRGGRWSGDGTAKGEDEREMKGRDETSGRWNR